MGVFDDDDEVASAAVAPAGMIEGDPDALTAVFDAFDAASDAAGDVFDDVVEGVAGTAADMAAKVEADFEADPVGFVTSAMGVPKVDIDLDDGDGHMSVKIEGALTSLKGDWDDAKGASAEGQAGIDWGAAPLLKGKVAVDADGELQELSTAAKLTIPIDGVMVSAEEATSYVKTDDGFKLNYSAMAGAKVDGIDLKGGTHAGYEDKGEHGYRVNVGPDVSAGVGIGEVAPGMDAAEVEAKSSADFSFGEVDGQTTVGLQRTDTAVGKVAGQTVASVQQTQSVAYTTGPLGEELILGESLEGTLAVGGASATGKVGGTWELGTDAEGDDVNRVTFSDEGKLVAPGFDPVTGGDSVTFDLRDEPVVADDVVAFDMLTPDYRPEVVEPEHQPQVVQPDDNSVQQKHVDVPPSVVFKEKVVEIEFGEPEVVEPDIFEPGVVETDVDVPPAVEFEEKVVEMDTVESATYESATFESATYESATYESEIIEPALGYDEPAYSESVNEVADDSGVEYIDTGYTEVEYTE